MMTSARSLALFFGLTATCFFGCEPAEINITKRASYSELVATYNEEVKTLDNLESKRKAIIAEYSEQAQAAALQSALSSLGSATANGIPSNPNDALDKAVMAAEAQANIQSGLRDKLGQTSSGANASSAAAELPPELKQKLAELDSEIAKQKERVDRAKIARDEAEEK